MIDEDQ